MSDITVDPNARQEISNRLGTSGIPIAGAVNTALGDGTITQDEMQGIVRGLYRVPGDAFVQRRAEALFQRIVRIAARNGNTSIESGDEARAFIDFVVPQNAQYSGGRIQIRGGDAHLIAGGVMVENDISDHNTVTVRMNCPGLTEGQFRDHIIPYRLQDHLRANVSLTASFPYPGAAGEFGLLTYTTLDIGIDTLEWPAITRLRFEQRTSSDGHTLIRAPWSLVPRTSWVQLLRSNRSAIAEALERRRRPHDDTAVNHIIEVFTTSSAADNVDVSEGFHELDLANGNITYSNTSDVRLGSHAPEGQVIAAAVATTMVDCGDARRLRSPNLTQVPAWIWEVEDHPRRPDLEAVMPAH